tara:strand:+ start:153 stop:518 length:366 start_codon:yes stop_codon:yes gene_type:complete
MKIELYKTNEDIPEVTTTSDTSYESIFNIYQDDGYFAYNILKSVQFPEEINSELVAYIRVNGDISWSQLSFKVYGDINLWWLICAVNKILNPVIKPAPGTVLKIIRPDQVSSIIQQIKNQL